MKKNKSTILGVLTSLVLGCFLVSGAHAADKQISWLVGHKNGGLGAALQTIVSQGLEAKGWDVDFKVVGNCGQVKEMLNSSKDNVIAGWGSDWNSNDTNTCFIPLTEQNFVNTLIVLPRLVCGPYNEPNFEMVKGNTYKIGVNAGQNHQVLLADLGKKIGVNFEVIEYKNSGFIKRAMKGKEIDMWYANSGLSNHGKTQRCFYSTAPVPPKDIKLLDTVLSTPNVYTSFLGYLITNDAIDSGVKAQLIKDIKGVIGSDEYQTKIAKYGAHAYTDNDAAQIKAAKATALAYRK